MEAQLVLPTAASHSIPPDLCWRTGAECRIHFGSQRGEIVTASPACIKSLLRKSFVMQGRLFLCLDQQHSAAGFLLYARFDQQHWEKKS